MKRLFIFLSFLIHTIVHAQINWQAGAGGVQWAQACDFLDSDMGSALVSGDQCGNKCLSTTGCTHFAWTSNPNTCWMKSGAVQKSDAKSNTNFAMICGIVPLSSTGINWQTGAGGVQWAQACDFSNHDMGSAAVSSDQCGGACIAKTGCTHFAWTSNPNSCWMKSGAVQQSDAIFNNNFGMICGIVPVSVSPPLVSSPGIK